MTFLLAAKQYFLQLSIRKLVIVIVPAEVTINYYLVIVIDDPLTWNVHIDQQSSNLRKVYIN